MSSLLFDANALIYWASPTSPRHDDVAALLRYTLAHTHRVYGLTSSLNEVYYVLHRHYRSEALARASISHIAETIDLVDLTGTMVLQAIESDEPDYEDALIRVAAEALHVDALVTYDKKAFRASFIPTLDAKGAIALLERQ